MDPNKPGYKTTEFWLTLFANAIGAWQQAMPENKYSLAAGVVFNAVPTLIYTLQRGSVKNNTLRNQPTPAPQVVDSAPQQ